jgi:AraC family transcriptional regulator
MNPSRTTLDTLDKGLEPRFEHIGPLHIAGLRGEYTSETRGEIPNLWQRFAPHIGNTSAQVGNVAYGVCFCGRGYQGFGYLAGVEVSSIGDLPADWSVATFPAQRYVVFSHHDQVCKLCETLDAIHRWLPTSGLQVVHAQPGGPAFFERYGEEFNPHTGLGGMEIWYPVEA